MTIRLAPPIVRSTMHIWWTGSKKQGLGLNVEAREYQLCCADDMVILTDDEMMLRRALNETGEWCIEWSVKVKVDKVWDNAREGKE